MSEKRYDGKVHWFAARRGYGFIRRDGDNKSFFVHHSEIKTNDEYKLLHENQRVKFSIGKDRNGKDCAINVEIDYISNLPDIKLMNGLSGGNNGTATE